MVRSRPYIIVVFSLFLALFLVTWGLTTYARSYFLPGAYGAWRARLKMMKNCDVGETVVLGDSRAGSAYVPKIMDNNLRNFGLSGSTPVEGYYFLNRIMACPNAPRKFILAYSPRQFHETKFFWNNSVAFGGINADELNDIAALEEKHAWREHYKYDFGAEPPPLIKNWLYLHNFPPYDFPALLSSASENRWALNRNNYSEAIYNKGEFLFPGRGKCPKYAADEAEESDFVASPMVNFYFRRILDAIDRSGGIVVIGPIPISVYSDRSITRQFRNDYRRYIESVASHYPRVRVSPDLLPVMDNCSFNDGIHVNAAGAAAFSLNWGKQVEKLL